MKLNTHSNHIYLKDGRVLTTTDNGFTKWVSKDDNPSTIPEQVSQAYYDKAKRNRFTKKNRRPKNKTLYGSIKNLITKSKGFKGTGGYDQSLLTY